MAVPQFTPGEVLAADKLNQLSGMFPVTRANISDSTIFSASSVTHSNWSNTEARDKIPDMRFMAYWNGAYDSNGNSNLQYFANNSIHARNLDPTENWVLLGKDKSTAAVTNNQVLRVNVPSEYANANIRYQVNLETSESGWCDIRAYDTSNNTITCSIQTIKGTGSTVSAQNSGGNYFIAALGGTGSSTPIQAVGWSTKNSFWRSWCSLIGRGSVGGRSCFYNRIPRKRKHSWLYQSLCRWHRQSRLFACRLGYEELVVV